MNHRDGFDSYGFDTSRQDNQLAGRTDTSEIRKIPEECEKRRPKSIISVRTHLMMNFVRRDEFISFRKRSNGFQIDTTHSTLIRQNSSVHGGIKISSFPN